MMYIEHTALEDNLHHILTNRVPTSSSPGATEAAAVAASALLARVREAQNGASTFTAPQVPHQKEPKFNKEWSRRPEPKLLPVQSLKKLLQRPQEQPTSVLDLTQIEDDGQEEEQYELLHVVDSDHQEEPQAEAKSSVRKGGRGTPREKIGDTLSTTHFVIDLKDAELPNKAEEEEEFEYVVTRVPRRRSHSQNLYQHHLGPHTGQGDSQASTSQSLSQGPQRASRPVPRAIPIEYHQEKQHNGNSKPTDFVDNIGTRGSRAQDYSSDQGNLNGYPEPFADPKDCNYYLNLKTAEARPENTCDNERCKKDAQMGLDIISKLRKIFSWNPSSDHYNTAQQESKRKRRSDDLFDDSPRELMIKYRKVDNRFPKYVAHTEDHDVMNFLPLPTAQSSKQFHPNMSARRSTSSIDKPPLRKSMFSAPNITNLVVKNTPYADIEFSDDDEPIVINPSTSAAAKHLPKVYNIPIMRTEERAKCMRHRQQPPPLIERGTGNILTSSMIADKDYGRKNTYGNDKRQNRTREQADINGYVLGTRNSSVSSLGRASTSESSRLQNGLNSLRTNHWSNITRSSILAQERESEQREQYQLLLEKVVPRLYGSSTENKIPTNISAQRRRSALLLGAASSSSRSSSANARRSVGLSQSILKRPPLSSTINLDEDGDDDVTFAGISQLKPSNRQSRGKPIVPTIIIDDDDISDIVEFGNAERHVLSQVGKIKQEENSILNICADKPKKPKNNALPYVEPVNSLRDRFSASPHIKDNWLDNWQSKWTKHKRNRLVEVKETTEVVQKFAAERIAAEAEIQERLRWVQIVDPELLVVDDFEDLIPEPEFVELGEEHRASINAAVFGGPPDQVLVSKFNLNITRRDIHTLCGHSWLNDEVINFYMNLLTERGDVRQSQGLPSVYAMNTFFVPRLLQAGHSGVKRWTRKVDIFARDIIPLPVHVGGVHWCMAIIHMKNRTIKYYDSMGTPNPKVLKALEQYLKDESLDKRKQPFDTSGFQIESVQGVPRQMNGSDCGVFSCMFAEYITRGKEITFSQQNMEYFRQKMILEIVTGELLH